MSQFDKISFGAQLVWFSLCFFLAYYFLIKYILPLILVSLKVREWRLDLIKKETKHMEVLTNIWSLIIINNYYRIFLKKNIDLVKELIKQKNIYLDSTKFYLMYLMQEGVQEYQLNIADILSREKIFNVIKEDEN